MVTRVQESVKVLAVFDEARYRVRPLRLSWNNAYYTLGKVDFFHVTTTGTERIYHFSLCDESGGTYFKLAFYTHSLTWKLEEIEDEPDC